MLRSTNNSWNHSQSSLLIVAEEISEDKLDLHVEHFWLLLEILIFVCWSKEDEKTKVLSSTSEMSKLKSETRYSKQEEKNWSKTNDYEPKNTNDDVIQSTESHQKTLSILSTNSLLNTITSHYPKTHKIYQYNDKTLSLETYKTQQISNRHRTLLMES